MVTYAAEETHNPERIIPRALMLGTAVVVVIYLALNSAYLLVLPFDRGADSRRTSRSTRRWRPPARRRRRRSRSW